jgi:integrase
MRLPKYRRNTNGQAFVEHKSIPSKSHRLYLGVYESAESRKKYAEFLQRLEEGGPLAPEAFAGYDKTISELIVAFLPWAEQFYQRRGQPTTFVGGLRRALDQLNCRYGSMLGRKFGPGTLESLQFSLAEAGYLRVTVNNYINRIRIFFRWACRYRHLPPALYHELASVKSLRAGRAGAKESPRVRPAKWSNVEKLLPFVAPQVAAMLQVQYLCGMRPEEVCVMRPMDLDCSGAIWWYRPDIEWVKTSWQHLNVEDAELIKAIPPAAQESLKPFLDRPANAYLFSPKEAEEWRYENRPPYQGRERKTKVYPCELRRREEEKRKRRERAAFRENKRDHYDTASYRHAILYGIKRAKQAGVVVECFSPNQIRHGIATDLLNFTESRETAQYHLGHKQLNTTGIYAEKQLQLQEKIAQKVQQMWDSRQGKAPRSGEEIDARNAKKKRRAAKLARMKKMMKLMLQEMGGKKKRKAKETV